jgi:hypothetical protein
MEAPSREKAVAGSSSLKLRGSSARITTASCASATWTAVERLIKSQQKFLKAHPRASRVKALYMNLG